MNNYQKEEQTLRNGSNYTFGSIDILNIHFHNIKLKRDSSYIDSPKWIKNKRDTINSNEIRYQKRPTKNNKNKSFHW